VDVRRIAQNKNPNNNNNNNDNSPSPPGTRRSSPRRAGQRSPGRRALSPCRFHRSWDGWGSQRCPHCRHPPPTPCRNCSGEGRRGEGGGRRASTAEDQRSQRGSEQSGDFEDTKEMGWNRAEEEGSELFTTMPRTNLTHTASKVCAEAAHLAPGLSKENAHEESRWGEGKEGGGCSPTTTSTGTTRTTTVPTTPPPTTTHTRLHNCRIQRPRSLPSSCVSSTFESPHFVLFRGLGYPFIRGCAVYSLQ
jgi:hypothetical protein